MTHMQQIWTFQFLEVLWNMYYILRALNFRHFRDLSKIVKLNIFWCVG